jgi:hypothetical protein
VAVGGSGVALRRSVLGPLLVEAADHTRVIPLEEALPRLAVVR